MFTKKFFASLIVIGLIAATTQANSLGIYQLGPFTAIGYGITEEVAAANAQENLDDMLDEIEDNLPPGHFIMGSAIDTDWDGFAFTITFTVFISDGT